MTLTKIKPRRAPPANKLRLGQHHHHSNNYLKTYWPYLPIALVIGLGFAFNNWIGQQNKSVLGYATDMSVQSLLDDTNAQRIANGEAPLTINAQLDQAAQAKADNMAALDYWSHDTPSGQTPWSFITDASYDYQTAGENLAYGFDTAQDVVTAWMNSPEHRANMLDTTYQDIGFGLDNIPNYQNSGPETLVDAMFASPASQPVVAATPPTSAKATSVTGQNSSSPTAAQSSSPTSASNNTGQSTGVPVNPQIATSTPSSVATATPAKSTPVVAEPQQQQITRVQLVADGNTSAGIALVILLGVVAFAFLLLRHGLAWRKTLVRGEKFVLRHPVFDIVAVVIVTASVLLTRTSGLIR
jgi:uncharacterized protein YkwD